jgi:acetyltransferase-like isoleucine patch superfamily enzyme
VTGEHPFTRFWLHPRRHGRLIDATFGAWTWLVRMGTAGPDSRFARRFGAVGPGSGFAWPPGPTMNPHLIHLGSGSLVGPDVTLSVGMWPDEALEPGDGGWIVRIGDRVNIGRRCSIVGRQRIEIGDDVTFAPGVYVTDHNHRYRDPGTPIARQWVDAEPVTIGSGSWLGTGAVVLPGTTIGRNVVVAAGTVVRGEVPDHAVVAGVPGRIIRRRTDGKWDPPFDEDHAPDAPPPAWE